MENEIKQDNLSSSVSNQASAPSPSPQVQTSQPQQQQAYVQDQPPIVQPEKPKSKSKLKVALAIIGGLILLGVIVIGFLIFKGVKDAPQVQQKVTDFLQYVSNNNFESAYALTSKEFKEATPIEDFTKAMSLFKAQYSGFQEQEQIGFNVEAETGKPTLYQYSGVITYADGDKGELRATLVKEEGEYKIQYIGVNVDIKRLEKFQQTEGNSVLGTTTER